MNGPFVPIEDLSKHFSVSVSTIRAWVRQGHIPKTTYIKVGNTYRFSVADVSTALANKTDGKPEPVEVVVNGSEAKAESGIPDDHWAKEITTDEDF